ncbi:uncharacterized protein N7515_004126 [Penicillium bovifimosum]|uniref:Uncharacterized protein n=1 Tax=Penicillium bovifimosum TaxID=126998 RepID=A0A9W9H661_9EURO|nr:uncharacterized protein N7515_004126 [Penicillium bovifimosum]KAJ5139278.1 hypothetical protein N7515_004126 [Penicillium bovifimosum]
MSTTRPGKRRIRPDEEPEEIHEYDAPLPQTEEATSNVKFSRRGYASWRETAFSPATQTSSGEGKRSAKLPDAPILDDGVSVKFTPWRRAVENKLMLNADHYPSERHRMAYVSTRCAGKAQAQLQPRLDPTVSNRYKTAVEMLDHLQIVFKDPMERQIAKGQYEKSKMKEGESSNLFYGEFARLALESKTDEELQKGDLFEKLGSDSCSSGTSASVVSRLASESNDSVASGSGNGSNISGRRAKSSPRAFSHC